MGFTAIDLFSGPGGLTLGMRRAGVNPIMGVEFNQDAVATYRGHTASDHRCADVRSVDFTPYCGEVDIVYGGPPCQPFSLGGLMKGQFDQRDMVPEFVRAVHEVSPAAFVMENVPGLLFKRSRPYFDWVVSLLSKEGFTCSFRVVNSADYGVPQRRKRVIIVGMRNGTYRFPSPTHGDDLALPYICSSEVIGEDPVGEPARSVVSFAPKVDLRPNPYHGHIYKGGGRPIDPNAPCQTIYASAGGNKTHWVDTMNVAPEYHDHLMGGGKPREGEVPGARRLSVEESALVQSFPREIRFEGSRSSQYRQVGDAVPPPLGEAIGRALVAQLEGRASSETLLEPEPFQPRLLSA